MKRFSVCFIAWFAILFLFCGCSKKESQHPISPNTSALKEWQTDSVYHWLLDRDSNEKTGKEQHSFDKWIYLGKATLEETGKRQRICLTCGYVELEEYEFFSEGLEYEIDTQSSCAAVIGAGTCVNDKTIVIPSEFNGYRVTKIVDLHFGYAKAPLKKVEEIRIPNTVVLLGENAFSGFSNLKTVVFSNNILAEIPDGLFKNCKALEEVILPNSVKSIGSDAFRNCNVLKTIHLENAGGFIGANAFRNCLSLETINLPEFMTDIGSYAFCNCESLSQIELPSGIKYLRDNTFEGCSKLPSVVVPESVVTIGELCFAFDTELSSVEIKSNPKRISSGTFYNCNNLEEITFSYSGVPQALIGSVNTVDNLWIWRWTSSLPRFKTVKTNCSINEFVEAYKEKIYYDVFPPASKKSFVICFKDETYHIRGIGGKLDTSIIHPTSKVE